MSRSKVEDFLSSRNGHRIMVMKLLRVGKDINICTSRGTVLHETALCGKVEMVKTVLVHGINTVLWDSAAHVKWNFIDSLSLDYAFLS